MEILEPGRGMRPVTQTLGGRLGWEFGGPALRLETLEQAGSPCLLDCHLGYGIGISVWRWGHMAYVGGTEVGTLATGSHLVGSMGT